MRDENGLTEQQRRFVTAFTSEPGCIGNASKSAISAGYSERSAAELGRQNLEKGHIQDAIREALRRQVAGKLAAKAVEVLEQVIDDASAPQKLRVEAAKTILDRSGIIAPRAPEAPDLKPKRLSEMSIAELEESVAQMRAQQVERQAMWHAEGHA